MCVWKAGFVPVLLVLIPRIINSACVSIPFIGSYRLILWLLRLKPGL